MDDGDRRLAFSSALSDEIMEFIEYKRQKGAVYATEELTLKAFDRFCDAAENQAMTPQQLAEGWLKPEDGKPKYSGCCVRQLGQYLAETGHPKAFIVLSDKGNEPRWLSVNAGPFSDEIEEFVAHKRSTGRKYNIAAYCLRAFDAFCAMVKDRCHTPQQLADAWLGKYGDKSDISAIREFGLHLTMLGSDKAFEIPHANGDMPKPPFSGYASSYAGDIELFLLAKRSAGLKYEHEEPRLKDFDIFCVENPDMSPQQLAERFIHSQEELGRHKGERSGAVIKELSKYLVENGCPNAFSITSKNCVTGPYAEEIADFVDFKKSCGFKYSNAAYHVRCFDSFCSLKENECLPPQQLADKWALKRDGEHPNTRASRIGYVRVFGKYLTSMGHPKAFSIADDAARGAPPKPPYLFSEGDIDAFFGACAEMEPDEKDPAVHIVLPAAFVFMHCMGVRTCELNVLLEHVNFDTGEVLIADAKNGDRTVYMSGELSEFLINYDLKIGRMFPRRKHMFPVSASQPRNDYAKRFKETWASSVPATVLGVPRLYDLRHHFLYRNVELCMRSGGDVNALRPYIMRHMGHRQPNSFQYYFHLSPPIRKEVSKVKSELDWMIPDVSEVPYEQ